MGGLERLLSIEQMKRFTAPPMPLIEGNVGYVVERTKTKLSWRNQDLLAGGSICYLARCTQKACLLVSIVKQKSEHQAI